jgi:regulatory protein
LPTITALQAQKHNPERLNVYLDGEYAFGLARIVAAWLTVGQALSEDKIAELQAVDHREAAYQKALRMIDYRDRTQAEVLKKLQQLELDEPVIQEIMVRLKRSGLVDDTRFARNWAANRSEFRPRSRRALAYELRKKGVANEAIQEALEEVDEGALAYQAAHKQAQRLSQLEWTEFKNKLYGFLARRGFSPSHSAEAVRRVWADMQSHSLPDHTDYEEE